MKFILSVLLISSCPYFLAAQQVVILSAPDSSVLPYSNIIYLKNDSIVGGTYTNKNGQANLILRPDMDKIEISQIGFETRVINIKNLPDKIYLKESRQVLNEVSVSPGLKVKRSFLGHPQKQSSHTIIGSKGIEMVTLMKGDYDHPKEIHSFHFTIKRRKGWERAILKVIFYENKNGLPGAKIPSESIIALDSTKRRKVRVRLADAVYLPPEGIFAGIERLGCIDDEISPTSITNENYCNCNIVLHSLKEKDYHPSFIRYRFVSQRWEDMSNRLDSHSAPAFGIEVYE